MFSTSREVGRIEVDAVTEGGGNIAPALERRAEADTLGGCTMGDSEINLGPGGDIQTTAKAVQRGDHAGVGIGLDGVEDVRVRECSADTLIIGGDDRGIDEERRGCWLYVPRQ